MIEERLIEYLSDQLDVPVLMEVPEIPSQDYPEWPDALVIIERVGGRKQDRVSVSSFAFQSYGESLHDAASLDERVRNAMDDFPVLTNIGRAQLSSCYNHTDTRSGRYRYQSTYNIYHMEV